MADMASTDVTARIRHVSDYLTYEAGQQSRMVIAEVTISLATNKAYDPIVGGNGNLRGVPLDALFTAGNASYLGFDLKYPLYVPPSLFTEANALDNEALVGRFVSQGVTAATQSLMLMGANGGAGGVAGLLELPDADLDAATGLPGATSITGVMQFFGRKAI